MLLLVFLAPVVSTRQLPANLSAEVTRMRVIIDGTDFGLVDQTIGLSGNGLERSETTGADGETAQTVTLIRDFVTDHSLYTWAKSVMHQRSDLKDIHVIMENSEGEEVSRYVLKHCKPLAWTVEAANPALGGFHETINLAVREISSY